ncbi:hypothetical protein PIB30_007391 [Stylosanthes scabra]|uniref:Pentatricopeptide repeat-containing protein n=1 Tax=Stylosanthes scabra TaxID=79078 RepID=A0ABU6Z6J7_9FABA|nr:hypothetical protein [Stylosanthes scabra]
MMNIKRVAADLNDDPLAKIIWDVKPQTLQYVFLAMAHNFPRTLVALVLHVLSQVGVEVLSMDQEILEKDRLDKQFVKPNGVMYSTVIDGLCKDGFVTEAKNLFSKMIARGISRDIVSYSSLFMVFVVRVN